MWKFAKEIVEVKRITTRIIKIKLVLVGNLMHVISAYAPQGGILVIGGYLNGHVGRDRNGFEDVMGIDGYGESGKNILEICQSERLNI